VLYAPGLRSIDQVRAICAAVSKPVNVLAHPKLTMAEVVDAGAKRISVGGSLAFLSVAAVADAARRLRDDRDFEAVRVPSELRELLAGF
jgi:2-methylisocitrate lyase-like PEP mutase family enzyme